MYKTVIFFKEESRLAQLNNSNAVDHLKAFVSSPDVPIFSMYYLLHRTVPFRELWLKNTSQPIDENLDHENKYLRNALDFYIAVVLRPKNKYIFLCWESEDLEIH